MKYRLAIVENNSRGRKKRIGSLIKMPDGRLGTFVGYCPNDTCSSKVCMDFDTARVFTRSFSVQRKKPFNRILVGMLQKLEAQSR